MVPAEQRFGADDLLGVKIDDRVCPFLTKAVGLGRARALRSPAKFIAAMLDERERRQSGATGGRDTGTVPVSV